MIFNTEKQMIEAFIARIHNFDPDILVAHGLC
jgi:DNA polymerase elongation subunit (family B)